MNEFLTNAIKESGMTKADIARAMGVTPQAVGNLAHTPTPRPDTLVSLLKACGWELEAIKQLKLVDVYTVQLNGKPDSSQRG
jgi:transcriptional regulator with XRE-family HTH domain